MALKAYVKSIEEIPEALRSLYVQGEDGGFRLDAEGVEDVSGLKSALQKEREMRSSLERTKKELEQKFDPKKYEELLKLEADQAKLSEQAELEKAKSANDWEGREKAIMERAEKHFNSMKSQYEQKIGEYEQKLKTTTSALYNELIDSNAAVAIAEAKGVPEILLPHVRNSCRVVEENGTFRVEVVDTSGNARLSPDPKSTSPMNIKELVGEMREHPLFGRVFDGSGASGMGSRGGQPGSFSNGAYKLSRTDAQDLRKYEAAKASAEKAGVSIQIVD